MQCCRKEHGRNKLSCFQLGSVAFSTRMRQATRRSWSCCPVRLAGTGSFLLSPSILHSYPHLFVLHFYGSICYIALCHHHHHHPPTLRSKIIFLPSGMKNSWESFNCAEIRVHVPSLWGSFSLFWIWIESQWQHCKTSCQFQNLLLRLPFPLRSNPTTIRSKIRLSLSILNIIMFAISKYGRRKKLNWEQKLTPQKSRLLFWNSAHVSLATVCAHWTIVEHVYFLM